MICGGNQLHVVDIPSLILKPITESLSWFLPRLLAPLSAVTLTFLYPWPSSGRSEPRQYRDPFPTLAPVNLPFVFMHSKLEQSFVGQLARWANPLKVTCWNKLHKTSVSTCPGTLFEMYLCDLFCSYYVFGSALVGSIRGMSNCLKG